MSRHRILLQTNPTWLKTGLAENARTLLSYLYKTGRYDIAHLCTQSTLMNDPRLALTPWKSYGAIPADQEVVNRINSDPLFGRDASYGALGVEAAVQDWKPSIWIGSDDTWGFPLAYYADKPWYKRVNALHHITVDSIPVLGQCFEQAKRSKHYLTWAKFAAREMQRAGGQSMSHVGSIYGAMDTNLFSPISDTDKAGLRRRFSIPDDVFIFLFVFRNQLRKSANTVLEAFARFKAEHPHVKAALHFHTSFSEKGAGWDLPMMAQFYGVKPEELLCTYVCKGCGSWIVTRYQGEDLKCPICGADKGLVTANISHGVPGNQMRLIYGMSDACISAFTSGGQELHSCQALLCGKPLACTNYSCGEDFCVPETEPFVYPLKWHPYHEPGTNFIKAANDVGAVTAFMRRAVRTSKRDLQEAAEKGRDWAVRTFGIEAVGGQWEKLFAALPLNPEEGAVEVGGAGASAAQQPKNPEYQPPDISDNIAWLKDIYKGILLMEVADNDSGLSHWLEKLAHGVSRDQIITFFRGVATQENAKMGVGTAAPPGDLWGMLDKTTGRKRAAWIVKESIGDCLMMTQLFEAFHVKYPNHDLYVITDPKHNEVFMGNPHVFRVLPWFPACEQETIMIGAGQTEGYFHKYFHPAIQSQRQLNYISRD